MNRNLSGIAKCMVLTAALAFVVTGPAVAEDLSNLYTLEECPHCGHAISKDSPVEVIEGREMRFCNAGCSSKVEADTAKFMAKLDDMIIAKQAESYPLTTCIMSGRELGDSPVVKVYGNRAVAFCCENCPAGFAADLEKNFAKLDAKIIEEQSKTYPLKTCPVSGEELGSMGEPINLVVANQLVKLCCEGCIKGVKAEPAKILGKVTEAKK